MQKDQIIYDGSTFDSSWDGVWESAVSVDAGGWSAELKIPLSLLRFKEGSGPQTWGINFSRTDQGVLCESSRWLVVPRGDSGFVSRFPDLSGLEGLAPQPRREYAPYLGTARKFETARSYDDRGSDTRAGLDARWSLNTHAQVDLSVRPDFGQVEVDQAVLNLGTVETFFPEKRPFFLVYTHGVSTDALINDRASLAPRPDLSVLRHLPSDDVVQAKVSWLFR